MRAPHPRPQPCLHPTLTSTLPPSLRSWKKTIKSEKMVESSKVLSQNLFLLNDTFQPSLLRVRELCVDASLLKLHQIKQGECHTLEPYPYPYP